MRTFAALGFAAAALAVLACPVFAQTSPASAPTERKADHKAGTRGNRARLLNAYRQAKAAEKEQTPESKRSRLKKLAAQNGLGGTPEAHRAETLKKVRPGYTAGLGVTGKWTTGVNGKRLLPGAGLPYSQASLWNRAKERLAKGGSLLGHSAAGQKSKSAHGIAGYGDAYGTRAATQEADRLSYVGGAGTYSGTTGYSTGLTSGNGYLSAAKTASHPKQRKKAKNKDTDKSGKSKNSNKNKKSSEDKDKNGDNEPSQNSQSGP